MLVRLVVYIFWLGAFVFGYYLLSSLSVSVMVVGGMGVGGRSVGGPGLRTFAFRHVACWRLLGCFVGAGYDVHVPLHSHICH